jgi:hypothetical protein
MSIRAVDCSRGMTHEVDLSSAVTYVPALLLLLWTTAVAGVSCVFAPGGGSASLVIVVYTANWLLQGVANHLWRVLPRGVSVWLAWVAYGDLMMATEPLHSVVAQTLVELGVMACGFAAALAFPGGGSRQQLAPIAVVVAALTVLALFPGPTASFSRLGCTDRVVKTAVFSLLFGFLHIFLPASDKLEVAHTQRVTMASGWVLFVGKFVGLLAAPWMVLLVLHRTGNLGVLQELRGGSPRAAADEEAPPTHAVTPPPTAQLATMRTRGFDSAPDVARLQALAAQQAHG